MLLSGFVRSGAGPQACAGAPEGRGLWRSPVELWKLHLPQPPCAQPLWTMRDAALHLSLALHCPTLPILGWYKRQPSENLQNLSRGLLMSINNIPSAPLTCWGRATIPRCPLVLLPSTTPVHFDPVSHWRMMILLKTAGDSSYFKCMKWGVTHCMSGSGWFGASERSKRLRIEEEELRFS